MTRITEETDIEKLHSCSLCLWRMPLASEAAVFTHSSTLVCFLFWCVSRSVSWIYFALPQCFNKVIPSPQVCRLHPGDAEADLGADAGRRLAVLHLVHTHLSEQSHSPPLHCRWVHSSIAVKVTLQTGSAAEGLWYNPELFSALAQIHLLNAGRSTINYHIDLIRTKAQMCFLCIIVSHTIQSVHISTVKHFLLSCTAHQKC